MTDQTTSPVAAAQLPLTLISLDDWALVTCQGADAIKYIQGQVTADVENMPASQHVLAAHCDAKGKMWSNLRLFHRGEGLGYLVRRNLVATQLTELKKYAVFSKVTFNQDNNVTLLGVAGTGARAALATHFATLPDAEQQVVQDGENTLLHFAQPAERFLLITTAEKAQQLQAALADQAALANSQQWLALDIEAGIPIIDSENSAQHIPQATNLQALAGGISFKKGCYTGQEMVARAKFRGANKRALYWLAGSATQVPAAGDAVEMQLGENWRRTGTILSAIKLADEQLWVQIVMNNDLESDTLFRVREDNDSRLNIQPLPYSLLDEK